MVSLLCRLESKACGKGSMTVDFVKILLEERAGGDLDRLTILCSPTTTE